MKKRNDDNKNKSGYVWVLFVTAIFIFALIPGVFILRIYIEKQILKTVKEIPEVPLSGEAFDKLHPLPRDNNKLLMQFFSVPDSVPAFEYGEAKLYSPVGLSYVAYDSFVMEKMEEYYSNPKNIARAEAIEKIMDSPCFKFVTGDDFAAGDASRVLTSKMRDYIAFITSFKIYPMVRAGKTQEALDLFIRAGKLVDIGMSTPMFLPYLLVVNAEMTYLGSFPYLLARGGFSDEQLIQMDLYFAEREDHFDSYLLESLSCEVGFMYLNFLRTKDTSPKFTFSDVRNLSEMWTKFMMPNDMLYLFREMKKAYPYFLEPNYIFKKKFVWGEDVPLVYILSGTLLPFSGKVNGKHSLIKSFNRAVRIAIAVERFRLKYGKIPDALSELVPEFLQELPVNLLTGEAFEYAPENQSFAISYFYQKEGDSPGKILDGWDNFHCPGYVISYKNEYDFGNSIFVRIIHADLNYDELKEKIVIPEKPERDGYKDYMEMLRRLSGDK